MRTLLPEGWPRPKGYANGIAAEGRFVFVAGMIGWDETGAFPDKDFIGQVRRTLASTLAVLKEGGAGPEHIARMTWYVTDKREYLANVREIGANGGGSGGGADRGRGEGRDRDDGGGPLAHSRGPVQVPLHGCMTVWLRFHDSPDQELPSADRVKMTSPLAYSGSGKPGW
jgi:hypothetical protein